jgi:hypothetical protein
MPENKDIFDKSAGESLRNFEQEPPTGLWERIESGIKRRHRKILLFRYGSIAATLLLLLSTGILYLNDQPNTNPVKQFTQSKSDTYKNAKTVTVSDTTKSVKNDSRKTAIKLTPTEETKKGSTEKGTVVSRGKELNPKAKTDTELKKANSGTRSTKSTVKSYKILNNTQIAQQNEVEITTDETYSDDRLAISAMPILTGEYPVIKSPIRHQYIFKPLDFASLMPFEVPKEAFEGSWNLALGYGMTSGSDLTEGDETLESRGKSYSYDDFSAQLANQTSYFEEIDNTIHDAPITIGLMVGKSFTERLSLETGITYTRLAFRIKTDDLNPFYRKYRNEMFYLGVPAGIRYSFLIREKFKVYALQWAVLEKGIAGRWHIDTYNDNKITESESKEQIIRGVQFSTVTALGAQYKLTGNIYLFGQGGVQVFYLNKTQPFNIRSQKVAWPSIQAGLRIDLK